MTTSPKEKAQELVEKFTQAIWETGDRVSKPMAKACALIAVDEIIAANKDYWEEKVKDTGIPHQWLKHTEFQKYWEQVKEAINQM